MPLGPRGCAGFKFEYRAVGSSQAPHRSNTILNTILADVARDMTAEIGAYRARGLTTKDATKAVIKDTVDKNSRVLWDGNGYSEEWRQEAARRGLLNLRTTVDCLKQYATPKNIKLFKDLGVLSEAELVARKNVFTEEYSKIIASEANVRPWWLGFLLVLIGEVTFPRSIFPFCITM